MELNSVVPPMRTALARVLGLLLASGSSCSVADLTAGGPLDAAAGPSVTQDAGAAEAGNRDGSDEGPYSDGGFVPPSTPVVIKNLLNNRYLDVANLSTSDGAQVWAWSYTGGTNQLWTFMAMGDGSYEIANQGSGKCLEVRGATTGNGSYIQQYGCWGGDNQRWLAVSAGGNVQIIGKQSGRCLQSSTQMDGATVTLWDCSNMSSEQWAVGH